MKPRISLKNDVIRQSIETSIQKHRVAILPPMDVIESLHLIKDVGITPKAIMLDPWYNKGFGGVRDDYREHIISLLTLTAEMSDHTFLWGFPEIIAYFVDKIPAPLSLVAWLTWYYKNNPSVIRGWRSSQNACLHMARPGAKLYPEHFLNEAQKKKQEEGKLRYIPGPTSVIEAYDLLYPESVIEAPLLVGFVGKKEQTGHPSQKPVTVFERIFLMTTKENDLVFDPMSGSATTAAATNKLNRLAIICDHSEEYTQIAEERLKVQRISIS